MNKKLKDKLYKKFEELENLQYETCNPKSLLTNHCFIGDNICFIVNEMKEIIENE